MRGAAVLLVGLAGLVAAGCSDTTGTKGQGDGPAATAKEGPVGQAQSAILSGAACVYGQVCQSLQATVTLQRGGGVGNVVDSGINNNGVSSNNGSGMSGTIPVGDSGNPATARQELMNFDLTPITNLNGAAYTGVSGQVSLWMYPNSANQLFNVHQALAAWSENTVSWVSFDEQLDPTVIASFNAGPKNQFPTANPANNVRFYINNLVSGWLNGTIAQDGFLLEQPPVPGVSTIVLSSEFPPALSGNHPTLWVTFNVTCQTGTADCNNADEDPNDPSRIVVVISLEALWDDGEVALRARPCAREEGLVRRVDVGLRRAGRPELLLDGRELRGPEIVRTQALAMERNGRVAAGGGAGAAGHDEEATTLPAGSRHAPPGAGGRP